MPRKFGLSAGTLLRPSSRRVRVPTEVDDGTALLRAGRRIGVQSQSAVSVRGGAHLRSTEPGRTDHRRRSSRQFDVSFNFINLIEFQNEMRLQSESLSLFWLAGT